MFIVLCWIQKKFKKKKILWQFTPATRHLSGFCWGPPIQDTGRSWFEDAFIGDGKMVFAKQM